jgi:SWI/SNF-related matrix-associated actin-dependent regulator 1 of chromatin subfamily A
MTDVMIRRRKVDVLKDLPAKTVSVITLPIDRKEYQLAVDDFLTWLASKGSDKARRAAKAEGLVKLGALKRLAGELKLQMVCKWVDDFLSMNDGKLVLFAIHKKIIRALQTRYKSLCVVVDGSVSNRDRQIAVDSFQRNTKCRLFIGNIKAAGVGLTLTAASTVAFAEIEWSPGMHVQAEDRVHRIGQVNASMIYYFVAEQTIETHLLKILQRKQKVINQVVDGGARNSKGNIYRALIREITRAQKVCQ